MNRLVSIPIVIAVALSGVFTIEREIVLPESVRVSCEKAWTDWSFAAIDYDGTRLALIRSSDRDVVTVDLGSERVSPVASHSEVAMVASHGTTEDIESFDVAEWRGVVATHGRSRDEVSVPLAVDYSPTGQLLVSDMGNRRILIFNSDESFASSFLLTGLVAAPNDIRLLPNGTFLGAGLHLDTASAISAGHYCSVFSPAGEVLNSFAYTPKASLEKKLWTGVSAVLDIADDGTIYAVFSTEPRIYVYSPEGELLHSFEWQPQWFVAPESLAEPVFLVETPPPGFFKSWTRIIKLVYVNDNELLIVAEANDLVGGCESRFIMDVVTTNGKVLHSDIATDDLPVGCDKDDNVYFLTLQGDRVLKTRLTK